VSIHNDMIEIVNQGRIGAMTLLDRFAAFDTVDDSFFWRSYKGGSESLAVLLDGWLNISAITTTPFVSAVGSLRQCCSLEYLKAWCLAHDGLLSMSRISHSFLTTTIYVIISLPTIRRPIMVSDHPMLLRLPGNCS